MLSLENLKFIYEPYPIGVARNVLRGDLYEQMVASFPPQELFQFKAALGNKYSLSEVNHPDQYHEFIRSAGPWREFYQWIKRPEFPHEMLALLRQHHIDLGDFRISNSVGERVRAALSALKQGSAPLVPARLSTRFEFSMLPAHGGYIKPHTDGGKKLVTLVVSLLRDGAWDPADGGGTEVLKPKDATKSYNFINRQMEFDEVETLTTFDYQPNQCVLFIKTFNSLHGVRPMLSARGDLMRKTLTINIETVS